MSFLSNLEYPKIVHVDVNGLGGVTRSQLKRGLKNMLPADASTPSRNSYLTARDITDAYIQDDGLGFLRDYIVNPPTNTSPEKLKAWYEEAVAKGGGVLNSRYNPTTKQYDITLPGSSPTASMPVSKMPDPGRTAYTTPEVKTTSMTVTMPTASAGTDSSTYISRLLPVSGPPSSGPVQQSAIPVASAMPMDQGSQESSSVEVTKSTSGFGLLLLLAIPAAYFASKR